MKAGGILPSHWPSTLILGEKKREGGLNFLFICATVGGGGSQCRQNIRIEGFEAGSVDFLESSSPRINKFSAFIKHPWYLEEIIYYMLC